MSDPKEFISIPVSLPGRSTLPLGGVHVLAGDIGGTKTNLALFHASRNKLEKLVEKKYASGEFSSVAGIIDAFLMEDKVVLPQRICLGVAGPVLDGRAELTNLDWVVDCDQLLNHFQVENVSLINDLEAIAYGLSELGQQHLTQLCKGNPLAKGNMAIIAPGTGLGQAGLFWDGKYYHPFPTEGGHCDFSPRTQEDYDLFKYLQSTYGVVSWEKLISGPAIVDMFNFFNQSRKGATPAWLQEQLKTDDAAAAISGAADDEKDDVCVQTMRLFVKYLARECSNLVLKMKATGGLFIGGGIPPKIVDLIKRNDFYKHFMDCDRMQHLLEEVPVYIVKNEQAGLIGAACHGAYAAH
jgi:glucokinase